MRDTKETSPVSSNSSTINSILQALGGSNGIDVTSAVDSILYADRAPERTWQAEQTTLSNQTAAINQISSDASTLSDQLSALQDPAGSLGSVTATSSDSTVLTATAASGTASGNYTVVVNHLATTASWYTSETEDPNHLGSGSIDINGTAVSYGGSSGNDTLSALAASINSQSLGVTASVVTDAGGSRLALISTTSGSNPSFNVSEGSSSDEFTVTAGPAGANASLTVDGVPISSTSNTVTGAIPGVTLNLQSEPTNGETVNLTLSANTSSIETAVSSFVTAYNSLIDDVNTEFSFNSASNTAGPLQDDSTIQSLQSSLYSAADYTNGTGAYSSLTALGITTNSDGTLSLDTAKLDNAVTANPTAVATFFQGTASNGFAASLMTTLNTYTSTSDGAFTVDLRSISNENTDLTNQVNQLEIYLSGQQTLLTTEYNQADIELQQLPQTIKNTQALLNPNEYNSSN